MTSTSLSLSFCILVATMSDVYGQEGPRPPASRQGSFSISYEAIPVFLEDTTKAFVNVHYRLREDFFIILRNSEPSKRSPFIGRGELAVELLNESGISVAREIRQILLQKNSLSDEDEEVGDLQGVVPLAVPEGTYTIVFNVEDKQSERKFFDRSKKVTSRKPLPSGLDLSLPIFVHPSITDSDAYEALNRGTDILFGNTGGVLFSLCGLSKQQTPIISYKLTNEPDFEGLDLQEFSGSHFITSPGIPVATERKDSAETSFFPVAYTIRRTANPWWSIYVPLPLEKLLPGRSKLSINLTGGDRRKDFTVDFTVHWFSRPFSLANFDLAVDALRHIASDEEMGEFESLSSSRSARKFFDFWKKKDPDTTTAYNELLAEYYRRVDIAIRQYSTSREKDGYKTDRGRIFVLYGTPTNTQRVFSPDNAPREIWIYSTLKRRFIFEDTRKNGSFILIGTEPL